MFDPLRPLNRLPAALGVVVAVAVFTAVVAATGAAAAIDPAELDIAFQRDQVVIEGTTFDLPVGASKLEEILGPSDRKADLANTILTWDDLGVMAYCHPGTTEAFMFAVCLTDDPDSDFWPNKVFSGKVEWDGVTVDTQTTIQDLNERKSGKPLIQQDWKPAWWRVEYLRHVAYWCGNEVAEGQPQTAQELTLERKSNDALDPKEVHVGFDRDAVVVEGERLLLPVDMSRLESMLGPADRKADLANTIMTWDNLGLMAYCKPKTTSAFMFAACLADDPDSDFWPNHVFVGRFMWDGVPVDARTTIQELNRQRTGPPLVQQDWEPAWWRVEQGEHVAYWIGNKVAEGEPATAQELTLERMYPSEDQPAPSPVKPKDRKIIENTGSTGQPAPTAPACWKEFIADRDGFSVLLPGDPKPSEQSVPTAEGPVVVRMYTANDTASGVTYLVGVSRYPSATDLSNTDSVLDAERDGMLSGGKATLKKETKIRYGDYPGRDIRATANNGASLMRTQMYLVRRRLYMVSAVGRPADMASASTTRYYESFQLR